LLNEDVDVIGRWHHNKIIRWLAHFDIKAERQKAREQQEQAKQKAQQASRHIGRR
jgi:hypothetical protein